MWLTRSDLVKSLKIRLFLHPVVVLGFYVPTTAKVIRLETGPRFKVSSERLFLHLIRSKSIEIRKRICFEKSAEIVLYNFFISSIYSFDQKFRTNVKKEFQEQKILSLKLGQRFACHGGCPFSDENCHPSLLWLSS